MTTLHAVRGSPAARSPGLRTLQVLAMTAGTLLLANPLLAHEHTNTHYKLTLAAVQFADHPVLRNAALNAGLAAEQIAIDIAQGVIDEDECVDTDDTGGTDANGNLRRWGKQPNWNSHFYEAKRGVRLGILQFLTRFGCDNRLPPAEFTTAAERAHRLWQLAIEDYRDGTRLREAGNLQQARAEFRSAYRILGRVLHLLQDMTSPAHVHDSPHAQILDSSCGNDSDDFERWGWCGDEGNDFISEYFHPDAAQQACLADFDGNGTVESYGVPPAGMTCRLWSALHRLYGGKPQGEQDSLYPVVPTAGQSLPFAFVHYVANQTYDYTTFRVHLKDVSPFTDVQDSSELKSMLRGSGPDDCGAGTIDRGLCEIVGGWWIGGEFQRIGRTQGFCGSVESALPDASEEWYVMESGCSRRLENFGTDIFVDGFAFIENIGGEGAFGLRDDSFIPLRYGCTAADSTLCGDILGSRSKILYQRLYGTISNRQDPFEPRPGFGKSMLRIYGDVLYPTAVAYGAGLINEFVAEATVAPVADAGGPYEVAACEPVMLDASASTDDNGSIVSYEWDFTDDGSFDVQVADAVYAHRYPEVFLGQVRLRVMDDDGFDDEALAGVTVTADVTPPVITAIEAQPPRLWPPNHKLVTVTVAVTTDDACGDGTSCRITAVTSSDPVTSRNDRTSPDWLVTGDLTVKLRAERKNDTEDNDDGGVQPRDYTLAIACSDGSGNTATGNLVVRVDKSASGRDDEYEDEDEDEDSSEGDGSDSDNPDEPGTGGASGESPSTGGTDNRGGSSSSGAGASDWMLLALLLVAMGWRRGGDSNPRYGITVHSLSRRAP